RSYSKKLERLEEDFRDNDPRLNASFNALAANSPIVFRTPEARATYINLIASCRQLCFLECYQRPQHRKWRFRAFTMRQRADDLMINLMAGRGSRDEWENDAQRRIVPEDRRRRRRRRREEGQAAWSTLPIVFFWGDRSIRHHSPWAPVPSIRLPKKAAVRHLVLMVDEFLTSQVSHEHFAGYEDPLALLEMGAVPEPRVNKIQQQTRRLCTTHKHRTLQVDGDAHKRVWCLDEHKQPLHPACLCADSAVLERLSNTLVESPFFPGRVFDKNVMAACNMRFLGHREVHFGDRPLVFQP
ncbi:hypothetical protein HDV05_004534, partial [Chytridiales sp. JEL 0842]